MAEITQRVVWTACPAGISEDRKRFRIHLHVSPRLVLPLSTESADLSQFPAWQDWPEIVANARYTVTGLVGGDRPAVFDPVADTSVWQALFPRDTPVIPHAFDDYRGKDVLTHPLAALAEAIEAQYAELAATAAGPALPRTSILQQLPLFGTQRETRSLSSLLELLKNTDSVEALKGTGTMLALLAAYHRPLATQRMRTAAKRRLPDGTPDPMDPHEDAVYRTVDRVEMPRPEELRDQIDFHRIVAGVGQHPLLMRLAGLSIPIEVERDGVPDGVYPLSVQVRWNQGEVKTLDDVFCVTRAKVDSESFLAFSNSPLLNDGWLRADDPSFKLVQLDVDGAGLSVKNFALQLPNIAEERFDDDAPMDQVARAGTPRLRTAGIQFAQDRRDVAIRGLFQSAGGHNDKIGEGVGDGQPAVLSAEDLIKGWRVDVLDDARGRWQSLMRFDGEYRLLRTNVAIPSQDEEAVVRLAATATADDQADAATRNVLKASEALFGWTGWSLAAPAPGRVVMPDAAESVGDAPNEVPAGLPLATVFTAHPKSLPVLRFGHSYRVRMRSADLTGWGPGWTPRDVNLASIASPSVRYGRYEPVETPVLTLMEGDADPADGESMTRAALRTMDDPARDARLVRRNVAPARAGHRFVEMHGVIDDGDGHPRVDLYPLLVDRDSAYAAVVVVTNAWAPPPDILPPGGAEPPPEPEIRTTYTIAPESRPTPYLPDPLAAGCAIRVTGVPSIDEGEVHYIPFYGDDWKPKSTPDWPNQLSFAIIASPDGGFGWDAAARRFLVPLDKAERARLFISALMPDAGIELMKLKELTIARFGVERWSKIEPTVRAGQHWMFTPSRMVELVHAVQRPLVVPSLIGLHAGRTVGNLTATIGFRTPLHAKSTARLDLDGDWIEIDDVSGPHPIVRRVAAHGFDRKLFRLETPNKVLSIDGNQVFADTRTRRVAYQATATTRFREYMPRDIRDDADQVTVKSEPRTVWVPSAACPPAPAVRYIVPTFGWTRSGQGTADQRSWRRGGGLRVYLDRPWFASGSNEMLAVCLPRGGDDPQVTAAKNYVTQWGADPAWIAEKVQTIAPAARDFPLRIDGGPVLYAIPPGNVPDPLEVDPAPDGLAVPPFANGPYHPNGAPQTVEVDIVPHAVGYDRDRGLWYCDIVVQPGGAYFPFIRLALARFQPASIADQHLSAAVLADFAQLTADRLVIVAAGRNDLRQRTVSVYGNAPTDTPHLPQASLVRTEVQRLKSGGDPNLDWVRTDEGSPRLPLGIPRDLTPLTARRARLTRADRVRLIEAERLVQVGRFGEVLTDPGLFELLRPPLIHEETITLPLRGEGERLRLLITEIETYDTGPESLPSGDPQERIVYAETIEL